MSPSRFDLERVLTVAQALHERGRVEPNKAAAKGCLQRALCFYDDATRLAPASSTLAHHEPFIAALLEELAPAPG